MWEGILIPTRGKGRARINANSPEAQPYLNKAREVLELPNNGWRAVSQELDNEVMPAEVFLIGPGL